MIKSAVSWHPYLGHLESFNSNSIPRKTSLVGPLRVKSSVRSMIFQLNSSLVGPFSLILLSEKVVRGSLLIVTLMIRIIFLNKIDVGRSVRWSLFKQSCRLKPKNWRKTLLHFSFAFHFTLLKLNYTTDIFSSSKVLKNSGSAELFYVAAFLENSVTL